MTQLLAVTGHFGDGEGLLLLRADSNGVGAQLAGIDELTNTENLKAALVMFENPFCPCKDTPANLQPLVVVDHLLIETAQKAEVVLPAATFAESSGTIVSFDNRTGNTAFRRCCQSGFLSIANRKTMRATHPQDKTQADPHKYSCES